jgi:hypothetical protein
VSSSLTLVREAYVTALAAAPELAGVHISSHGGLFSEKEIAEYSRQAPAAVITLVGFKPVRQDGAAICECQWGLIVFTIDKPAAAARKARTAMDIAAAAAHVLLVTAVGSDVTNVNAPHNMSASNEFTRAADSRGLAIWGLRWSQSVELAVDTSGYGDLETLDAKWDVYPRDNNADLGDVIEAEDTIDLT